VVVAVIPDAVEVGVGVGIGIDVTVAVAIDLDIATEDAVIAMARTWAVGSCFAAAGGR
jgi:hypothetical protein